MIMIMIIYYDYFNVVVSGSIMIIIRTTITITSLFWQLAPI